MYLPRNASNPVTPGTEAPSPAQWQEIRTTMTDLYSTKGYPLRVVQDILAQDYNFRATERMLKSRISQWGISKHTTAKDFYALALLHQSRKDAGKSETEFIVGGHKKSGADLRCHIKRKGMTEEDFLTTAVPPYVRCVTPDPDEKSTKPALQLVESRTNPFRREGCKMELPMKFRNRLVVAVADTGSDINAVTRGLARRLKVKVRRSLQDQPFVKVGNGQKVQVYGQVVLTCSFAQGLPFKTRQTFNVFLRLAAGVQAVMGRPFLDHTKTMTSHRSRLRQRISASSCPRIMHINMPRRRLACYLDSRLVFACPDTGSEIDLVSQAYATKMGLCVEPVRDHEKYISLATGEIAVLSGKVKVRFDTYHPASADRPTPKEGPHEQVDPARNVVDGPGSNSTASTAPASNVTDGPRDSSAAGTNDSRPDHHRTFYILDGLVTDVLLGEELLYSIDAFESHEDSFTDLSNTDVSDPLLDMNIIKWLSNQEKVVVGMFRRGKSERPGFATGSARPDTSSIHNFLSRAVSLETMTENNFFSLLTTRDAQEASRRRLHASNMADLKSQIPNTIVPAKVAWILQQVQVLERAEILTHEKYLRDKQSCKDAWEAWVLLLQSAARSSYDAAFTLSPVVDSFCIE